MAKHLTQKDLLNNNFQIGDYYDTLATMPGSMPGTNFSHGDERHTLVKIRHTKARTYLTFEFTYNVNAAHNGKVATSEYPVKQLIKDVFQYNGIA